MLNDYQALGLENIHVVRSDEPRDKDLAPHSEGFEYASDLMGFIRPRYGLCLGVAGYPEAHIDAVDQSKDM